MGKLGDWDWWMGRTPEQQARRADARRSFEEAKADLATTSSVEGRLRRWGWTLTLLVTFPLVGFVVAGWVGLIVGGGIGVGVWAVRKG